MTPSNQVKKKIPSEWTEKANHLGFIAELNLHFATSLSNPDFFYFAFIHFYNERRTEISFMKTKTILCHENLLVWKNPRCLKQRMELLKYFRNERKMRSKVKKCKKVFCPTASWPQVSLDQDNDHAICNDQPSFYTNEWELKHQEGFVEQRNLPLDFLSKQLDRSPFVSLWDAEVRTILVHHWTKAKRPCVSIVYDYCIT